MGTYFPDVPFIGPVPILAIPAAALLILLVLVLLYHRSYRARLVAFLDTPDYAIQQLAKKTRDYGVAYSEIKFGKLLGKGSQGEVYLATWRGIQVAVKKVDTRTVPPEIVDEFCSEADIMRRLRHPCLTLFMGVSLEHPYLCIVTELVNRGALFDLLHEDSTGFTWKRALQIMTDVASGMTYLHAHHPPIIHRDLKSLNILVASNWRAKVADFGMTRFQDSNEEQTMTQCGSPLWMPPEMIKNENYDEKADVYSFAIVMWELYTRRVPYRELNLNPSLLVVKVVRDGLRPDIPKNCPKKFVALLQRCWHKEASQRPPFKEILKILEGFLVDKQMLKHKPTAEEVDEEDVLDADETNELDASGEFGGPHVQQAKEQDALVAETQELLRLSSKQGDGWQISDLNELEISKIRLLGESEQPPHPSPLSPGPHHQHQTSTSTLNETELSRARSHLIYKARYRGKAVVVKKCWIREHASSAKRASLQAQKSTPNGHISIPSDVSQNDATLAQLLRKTAELRHPNLVMFMGAYVEYDHVGVIEEEVTRGSLSRVLASMTHTPLEWEQLIQILQDTASGLSYLQSLNITHPDLTPKRLMVTSHWRIKISGATFINLDKKLAELASNTPSSPSSTSTAPESRVYESKINLWSAPETFEQDDPVLTATYSPSMKTTACNVYSFGLIMWSLLMRKQPFDGKFGPKLRRKIQDGFRLPVPTTITPKFKSLIKSCWSSEISKRPTFAQILQVLEQIKAEGPLVMKLDEKNSKLYRKSATVFAYPSKDPITILKDTGKNRGQSMNIMIASSTKPPSAGSNPTPDYWESFTDLSMADPEVFARTYEPTGNYPNEYRKTGTVRAKKMEEPFAIRTGIIVTNNGSSSTPGEGVMDMSKGTIEQGLAGDYIVQNDAGDQWVSDAKTMESVFVEIPAPFSATPGDEDIGTNSSIAVASSARPVGSSSASTQLTSGQMSTSTVDGDISLKLVGTGGGILVEATPTAIASTPTRTTFERTSAVSTTAAGTTGPPERTASPAATPRQGGAVIVTTARPPNAAAVAQRPSSSISQHPQEPRPNPGTAVLASHSYSSSVQLAQSQHTSGSRVASPALTSAGAAIMSSNTPSPTGRGVSPAAAAGTHKFVIKSHASISSPSPTPSQQQTLVTHPLTGNPSTPSIHPISSASPVPSTRAKITIKKTAQVADSSLVMKPMSMVTRDEASPRHE